jgi:hypothetical protein
MQYVSDDRAKEINPDFGKTVVSNPKPKRIGPRYRCQPVVLKKIPICVHCGRVFHPKQDSQKFCTRSCKIRNYSRSPLRRTKQNQRKTEKRCSERQYIQDYKKQNPCHFCGESEPACLDFHHRDPKEKKFKLSDGAGRISMNRVKEEIAKCILLCANCHRKVHIGLLSI